jgi:pimeloyl-ACP methyl ester carboxylesterase
MKLNRFSILLLLTISSLKVKAQVLDTLVDFGTYKLHFKVIKGLGKPILFETGGAMNLIQWDSIGSVLHQQLNATIITYDRQGFGKSGLDTAHYNILNEVKGLEDGLKQLGYQSSDVMLICHSLGAFYCRLYAARHPKFVKGIIMLDPRIPSSTDVKFARGVFQGLDRKKFKYEELSLYYVLAQMERNSDFLRKVSIPSHIPIVDIMAEDGPFADNADNERFKSDQERFVNDKPNRTLIFAKGSSHNIVNDKPELVISQVSKLYKKWLQ